MNERFSLRKKSKFVAFLLVASLMFLSACDNAEERAEKHFLSAIELLEEGDEERAIVEFRNVFKLDESHKEARSAYAELQRLRGNPREAISQYLRLIEQYPDDVEGQRAIAEIYAEIGNWPEMERYLGAAMKLDPDDAITNALQVVFDYRQAVNDSDSVAKLAAVESASEMSAQLPENIMLRQVVIDDHIRSANYDAARVALDGAIEIDPENRSLYAVRLSVLAALDDTFGIEKQLKDMIVRFPEDDTSRTTLVRWYVSQGQLDEAESYLRDAVVPGDDDPQNQLILLRFLAELRGQDVALQELNGIISVGDAPLLLHGLQAGYEFDLGNPDRAIGQLRDLLDGVEPSDDSRRLTIALSQMLVVTGNAVGGRALIEEVLVEDSSNVDALKLKAEWLIADDFVGDAIVALRTALEQAPRDTDILTLLARAHERDGNQDLVGEMLSLAVSASNQAPEESVRYARFLILLEKFGTAEGILVESLRLSPGNLDILVELGRIYVVTEDWPRADQVEQTLRRIELPEAVAQSNDLKARILQGQKKTAETVEFLEELLSSGNAGFGANIEIVRSYLTTGNEEKAQEYVAGLLADDPENLQFLFIDAAVDAGIGNAEAAETKYRALLDRDARQTQVWVALFRLLSSSGKTEEAGEAIETALLALPDDATLKWINAGLLEKEGDLEGAIAIYEEMYAQDSENLVIANNLASLISTTRSDTASIERANTIARRLRPSKVPPYQDTYGWIAYLRGEVDEAVRSLEPAARMLVGDPLVQYHLALAYLATKREDEALEQFMKVIELTGAADTRDFVLLSRGEINRLQSEQNNTQSD